MDFRRLTEQVLSANMTALNEYLLDFKYLVQVRIVDFYKKYFTKNYI